MSLIDRHIFSRFFTNFLILFALLFIFAVSIDLILNLDNFVDAARDMAGPDASAATVAWQLLVGVLNFQAPRVFQFYAYLSGLVAVGAMGFTLAQMVRHRELVAIMASGISLYRLAMPFIVAMFALSVVQLVNQELVLPRIAPLLLREHASMGRAGLETFAVPFTPDGEGHLLQSPRYDPQARSFTSPTFLERDAQGRTTRRITAGAATWSDAEAAWLLTNGIEQVAGSSQSTFDETAAAAQVIRSTPIERLPTDLTPQSILVRRYTQFASMLSLSQISQMLETPRIPDRQTLLRYRYSRFSSIVINLLILWLTLPCFLLREPANLMRQSLLAASLAIPASVGSAIGMMVDMPGIPPAASVFLPVVVLAFLCLFPWTFFKT